MSKQNNNEQNKLLSEIKLSYEVHKKVYNADMCFAIPQGKKCLAWFTCWEDKHVCFLLDIGFGPEGINILGSKRVSSCFESSLCSGTCLYGTYISGISSRFRS